MKLITTLRHMLPPCIRSQTASVSRILNISRFDCNLVDFHEIYMKWPPSLLSLSQQSFFRQKVCNFMYLSHKMDSFSTSTIIKVMKVNGTQKRRAHIDVKWLLLCDLWYNIIVFENVVVAFCIFIHLNNRLIYQIYWQSNSLENTLVFVKSELLLENLKPSPRMSCHSVLVISE